jgi:hypothetical protein
VDLEVLELGALEHGTAHADHAWTHFIQR